MFMLLDVTSAAGAGTTGGNGLSNWLFWGMLIVVVVAFYFFIIRPQKKQEKEQNDMKNSLKVGDDITTIGGIVGRVVKVKDDMFTPASALRALLSVPLITEQARHTIPRRKKPKRPKKQTRSRPIRAKTNKSIICPSCAYV